MTKTEALAAANQINKARRAAGIALETATMAFAVYNLGKWEVK